MSKRTGKNGDAMTAEDLEHGGEGFVAEGLPDSMGDEQDDAERELKAQGWTRHTFEFKCFYVPVEGEALEGELLTAIDRKDSFKEGETKRAFIVKLSEPCTVKRVGEKTPSDAQPGELVCCDERAAYGKMLEEILAKKVESGKKKVEIRLIPKKQVAISGRRKFTPFEVFSR